MPVIVQISDCHLFADPNAEIRGVRTRDRFLRVWKHFIQFNPRPDLLIITGDLTHDERRESYLALREIVSDWLSKLRVIPGNHDERSLLRETFGLRPVSGLDRIHFSESLTGWRLIGLDSHIPGQLAGELGDDQRQHLARLLEQDHTTPTILFLHHPPISINSPWLDKINLQDAAELRSIVSNHPQIRLICTGHVHQEFTGSIAGVPVLTAPSTGVQFRPGTESLELDEVFPGYRILQLQSDGSWSTEIVRVPE
jgi:Icc protein